MEKKITIGNVCFLQDKQREKILLLHRSKDPMKNLTTGVGGKTDFQEDIHLSCHREVYEETGIQPTNVRLKGILKTIVDGGTSSWVLFAYTGECSEEAVRDCDEGVLEWVPVQEINSRNIIGFIRRVLPHILDERSFFEGTIVHDMQGQVISDIIKVHRICDEHDYGPSSLV
jgi:8-oxo-dGTP diphosphatase